MSALRREDLTWATLDRFKRREEASLESIQRAVSEHGRVGVSFSGGKDSTVVLDLVHRVDPKAPAAFFDSGSELESTLAIVAATGALVIHPRMSMLDMARYAGWWDYDRPVDTNARFDAKMVVIQEPSEAFVVRLGLRVIAHGLRAEESSARARHATRGELYEGADGTWYLQPIIRWDLRDVWAYIASRNLPYNSAYDRMSEARVPRESQRVATLLGECGSGWGRHAIMQRSEPDRWASLVKEFPGLSRLT